MANPFLVLGGIAVGIVTAAFGVLMVPGWVAAAQDAAAINDLSNLNQAQVVYRSTAGMFTADITSLSGGAEASDLGDEAPVTTIAMSDTALASDEYGLSFKLSGGVKLAHLGINGDGDAYCAVVQSASGRYFASTSKKPISPASATGLEAMNRAECSAESRGDYTGLEPGTPSEKPKSIVFRVDTTQAQCKIIRLNLVQPEAKIDWGDGVTADAVTGQNWHSYTELGTYDVEVTGKVPSFGVMNAAMAKCVTEVPYWGDTATTSTSRMFEGSTSITSVAAPPATVTDMSSMFKNATAFKGDVSEWDVSSVTSMASMFSGARQFDADLSQWDVSSVTDFNQMFYNATAFTANLSKWDVGSAKDMGYMFFQAGNTIAGPALPTDPARTWGVQRWDVRSVTNFNGMFSNTSFNGDVSGWTVSKATNLSNMFAGVPHFNQDLSRWDVSNVTSFRGMFNGATSFDGDISTWNVGRGVDFSEMFSRATKFSRDLSNWDVSNATTMSKMFYAMTPRSDLSKWNVGNVTNMASMFEVSGFAGDISAWNVSRVTDMSLMFKTARSFNSDISRWDVSNVKNMTEMIYITDKLTADLSGWNVRNVTAHAKFGELAPLAGMPKF